MSWEVQENSVVKVLVSVDYCAAEVRTDFIIIDMRSGEHEHISVDLEARESLKHDCKNLIQSGRIVCSHTSRIEVVQEIFNLNYVDSIKVIFENNDFEVACVELIRFLSNDKNDYLIQNLCDELCLFNLCVNYLDCDYVDNRSQIEQDVKAILQKITIS